MSCQPIVYWLAANTNSLFLEKNHLFFIKNYSFSQKIFLEFFSYPGYRLATNTLSQQPIPSEFQKVHKYVFCP